MTNITTAIGAAVRDETIWLPASNGVDDTAAFQTALAQAQTLISGTSGRNVISGPPGNYKLLSNLYIPLGVGFETRSKTGGMRFTFPTDTGAPTLASLKTNYSAGTTTIDYTAKVGPNFASSGTAHISGTLFTYTGLTITNSTEGTFTGVTIATGASGAGTGNPPSIVQGYAMTFAGGPQPYTALGEGIQVVGPGTGTRAAWNSGTPPNSLDGVFLGTYAGCDATITGFRHATSFTTDHQRWGRKFLATSCYSAIHAASPFQSKGNQLIEGGASLQGMYWSGVYVDTNTEINVATFGEQVAFGGSPWGVYKAGAPSSNPFILTGVQMIQPTFEGMGLGLFGSEDGLSSLSTIRMEMPNATYNSSWLPVGTLHPIGHFKCALNNVKVLGAQTMFGSALPSDAQAAFVSDSLSQCVFENFDATATAAVPICKPVVASQTAVNDVRIDNGRLFGVISAVIANDILGYRSTGASATIEQAQRTNQDIAGVAVAASQNNVVACQQRGDATVNVAPGVAGASIPGGASIPVRLNNAAAGKATAASSWGDTNGRVFASAFFAADNGSTATIHLTGVGN